MTWYVKPESAETVSFLSKMAGDEAMQARYKADPHAVMDEHGLSDEAKNALTSEDHEDLVGHLMGSHHRD